MTGSRRTAVAALVTLVAAVLGLNLVAGVQRVTAGVASLLVSTTPIITVILEYLLVGQRQAWQAIAGVLVGFAGVAIVALGEQRTGGASQLLGAGAPPSRIEPARTAAVS